MRTEARTQGRGWGWVMIMGLLGLVGCPQPAELPDAVDAAVAASELAVPVTIAHAFEDCTPDGTSFSDVRCDSGLHCGMVLVGEAGAMGTITQCVPDDPTPLKEGQECALSMVASPATSPPRRYDRCANGLGCVETADGGGSMRCRRLCALRTRGRCSKSELCVLPTAVSGIGFCSVPDKCEPVFPQKGCGKAKDGTTLSCYVLGDDKGTGTVCWSRQRFGDSSGDLDSPCERSFNCQSGFGCVTRSGRDATCRPYCTLPEIPDGGSPPDGGTDVQCASGLGTCRPVSGYERVGRCY